MQKRFLEQELPTSSNLYLVSSDPEFVLIFSLKCRTVKEPVHVGNYIACIDGTIHRLQMFKILRKMKRQ